VTTAAPSSSIVLPLGFFDEGSYAMAVAATHQSDRSWLFDRRDRLWLDATRSQASSDLIAGAVAMRTDDPPPGALAVPLRQAYSALGEARWVDAGAALQRLRFAEQHRFCASCGAAMEPVADGSRRCESCGRVVWPPISPAVIVLVVRGREVLLARHRAHAHGRHTALAGFVSPGETLEQCAAREVREECGVSIETPRYVASQPWPFPHSLMCGFVARWLSGEPVPDGDELSEAGWFDRESLPQLPDPPALVHRLLEAARSEGWDR